jgi:3-oxoacyl-[acyl-carrier protein] reductase
VLDADAQRAWVDAAADEFGALHIVVVSAGGPPMGSATAFTASQYRDGMDLNLFSSIGCVEAALPYLREAGWGRILFVASVAGLQPVPFAALSNVAFAGLLGYSKSLAHAVVQEQITVNVLAPGPFRTGRLEEVHGDEEHIQEFVRTHVPMGRAGNPREFGCAAAFLASEQAAYITGTVMRLDGGQVRSLV